MGINLWDDIAIYPFWCHITLLTKTRAEILKLQFGPFCANLKITFSIVAPTTSIMIGKKYWQVLLGPWHIVSSIWEFLGPRWSIFPVKIQFSWIFPAPGGSPYQSHFLRYESNWDWERSTAGTTLHITCSIVGDCTILVSLPLGSLTWEKLPHFPVFFLADVP